MLGLTAVASGAAASQPPAAGTARQTTIAGLNPVAATMYSHPRLVAKLTPMLPKVMTLNQASEGFKSQGRQRRRKRAIDENRGLRD